MIRKWLGPGSVTPFQESPQVSRERIAAPKDIFDIEEAVDTFMGDREIVLQLLKTLTEKTARAIEEIAEGLSEEDMQKIRSSAHAVKGSSQNLSAMRVGAVAEELENAAAEGDRDAAAKAFDGLKSRYDELLAYSRKITAR